MRDRPAPPPLTWDELDQLADWTAGELTGAAAARVADLVRTDPRWSAAHADLVRATPEVQASLRAAADAPMPADVAARVDAALRAQGRPTLHPFGPRRRIGRGARPGSPRRASQRPAARPRQRPLLAAAAVAVLFLVGWAGFGVARQYLNDVSPSRAEGNQAPAFQEGDTPAPPGAQHPSGDAVSGGGPKVLATGTDYTEQTLPTLQAGRGALSGSLADVHSLQPALAPLATTQALNQCLAVVARNFPGRVLAVDFARYEGQPALIVLIEGSTSMVVAVGPDCGPTGPDLLAAAAVD